MSLIKICGLQREIDIEYANALKPDFIGFVFAESRRRITNAQALELKRRLDPSIKSVGVFVNADQDEISELCQSGVIDLIQLHGDEDNDYIGALKARVTNPIIKSLHFGLKTPDNGYTLTRVSTDVSSSEDPYTQYRGFKSRSLQKNWGAQLQDTTNSYDQKSRNAMPQDGINSYAQERDGVMPLDAINSYTLEYGCGEAARSTPTEADFLLFDTFHDKQRGGSGMVFDWSLAGNVEKPFFLAGGLNNKNVEEAILRFKPYAVDVSSGVEVEGNKDYNKMSLFINKVRLILKAE